MTARCDDFWVFDQVHARVVECGYQQINSNLRVI